MNGERNWWQEDGEPYYYQKLIKAMQRFSGWDRKGGRGKEDLNAKGHAIGNYSARGGSRLHFAYEPREWNFWYRWRAKKEKGGEVEP